MGESAATDMMGHKIRLPIENYPPMEIVQHKEPRKIETRGPERIRNPGIEVIVRIGRRIVSHQGGPLHIVIVIDLIGVRICHILRSGGFCRAAVCPPEELMRRRLSDDLGILLIVLRNGIIVISEVNHSFTDRYSCISSYCRAFRSVRQGHLDLD